MVISDKVPKREEALKYLTNEVLPALPLSVQPSFKDAIDMGGPDVYRAMANQYLTARANTVPGLICVGDSLNMRHPLTGGGMTVGLNDAVLLTKMLSEIPDEDLGNEDIMLDKMLSFHSERKSLDVVLNTLSIALYALFAADNQYLKILQRGCFLYLLRGGDCTNGPIGLLSGLVPDWFVLFKHFFAVAFYACYLNFVDRGILGFPVALYENISVLVTAAFVLFPYLLTELFS
ncbi:unnamed protein product [Ambrosiozyma monospora]|uniref:Squalene monooxygenase n=1 Tax=Ambrosiozyma monospora TaxID=43982 RepID=A0A9W6SXG0_AMBMO|nr:unnamed protein product [Ambrosiozyma monospora]